MIKHLEDNCCRSSIISSVYQLPDSVLFDETTRPSYKECEKLKQMIKSEIERWIF